MENITDKDLICKMFDALNMIKGFSVGYGSSIPNKCIIDYYGDTFFVKIEKRPGESMMHKDGAKIFDNLKYWE